MRRTPAHVFTTLLIVILPLFSVAHSAYAETTSDATTTTPLPTTAATGTGALETTRTKLQEQRTAIQERINTQRTALTEKRETIKAQRQDLMEQITQKRQEAMELFKAQRETFRTKLAGLRDERKKMIVDRIDNKISTINKNRTDLMSLHLKKLSEILGHISEKATTVKTGGQNTTSLDTAIATAQTAIATAQTAVATQAGKEYIIQITTETALRSTVGTTMKQFESDITTTHKTVVDAKQAVQKAATELAKLKGTRNTETVSTPSGVTTQ